MMPTVTLADIIAIGKITSAPVTNKAGQVRTGLPAPLYVPAATPAASPCFNAKGPDAAPMPTATDSGSELVRTYMRLYGLSYDNAIRAAAATDEAIRKQHGTTAAPAPKATTNKVREGLALPVITFNTLPRRS